jgi:hypothetical protein
VIVMGAYAAIGNMSPIEFAFTHEAGKHSDAISRLSNNFDVIEQPTMLGAWPAVSLLFHRRDVAEAKQDAALRLDDANVFDPLFRSGGPKELVRLGKAGIGFGQGQTLEQLQQLLSTQVKNGVASANAGELVHDAIAGTLLVNTKRTQAFAGFKPKQKVRLTNVELELDNAFGVVIVSALDDQPLSASKRILISALGNAINSGMTLSPGRNKLENPGVSPILVEPLVGRLALDGLTGTGHAKVHALGPNGERDHTVPVVEAGTRLSFGLSADDRSMHYEIVRE